MRQHGQKATFNLIKREVKQNLIAVLRHTISIKILTINKSCMVRTIFVADNTLKAMETVASKTISETGRVLSFWTWWDLSAHGQISFYGFPLPHLQIGSNDTCPSLLQGCMEKSRDIISNTKMSQNSHKSYNVSFRCFKNSNVQHEWNSFYVLF